MGVVTIMIMTSIWGWIGAIHTTEVFEILFSCIYQIFSVHIGDLGRGCALKTQINKIYDSSRLHKDKTMALTAYKQIKNMTLLELRSIKTQN